MPSPVLTIDMLRHGDTASAAGHLFGSSDVPLSELGKKQLKAAADKIGKETITHIVSSPLQRCSWLPNQHLNQITATFEPRFKEMDFGDWEGQSIQQLNEQGHNFQHNASKLSPPNGENFHAFSARVQSAWKDYIEKHLNHGGHHILVTHGGVMRVLIALMLHIPNQHIGSLYIPHASWSRVTLVEGEEPMLWFMNRHA